MEKNIKLTVKFREDIQSDCKVGYTVVSDRRIPCVLHWWIVDSSIVRLLEKFEQWKNHLVVHISLYVVWWVEDTRWHPLCISASNIWWKRALWGSQMVLASRTRPLILFHPCNIWCKVHWIWKTWDKSLERYEFSMNNKIISLNIKILVKVQTFSK